MYETMLDTIGFVGQSDPDLAAAMNRELMRQKQNIELIASEMCIRDRAYSIPGRLSAPPAVKIWYHISGQNSSASSKICYKWAVGRGE